MKPSITRLVYYFAYGTPGGEYPQGEERAAIITEVNEDGTVGLCVLNPSGFFFNRNVRQATRPNEPGTWDFTPFQKGGA